jgi:Zn-dependent alcohol dehydrogenase
LRAAVCRRHGEPLEIEELALDPPGPGEVRVRLAACAVCHSDLHFLHGDWGGELPAVFGHEAAGVVEAVGPEVSAVQQGDHVVVHLVRSCGECFYCLRGAPQMCESELPLDRRSPLRDRAGLAVAQGLRTGAFAEEVLVDRSQVVKVPDSLPLDLACLLACGVMTGIGAVTDTAHVPPGASVVVIGAGGVGLNSIQGAALSGADPVIAVDVAESKLGVAATFGATHGIEASHADAAAQVRSLTGGRGADYVFVTVGSETAIEEGLGMLRPLGTLVVVGMPPSGVRFGVVAVDFADAGLRLLGSKMGSSDPALAVPRLTGLYEQGRLKLDELISARYPLEEINEAIAGVEHGTANRNVIVFPPGPGAA